MQPGSIVKGNIRCANTTCTTRFSAASRFADKTLDFQKRKEFAENTLKIECYVCKAERKSRKLVADTEKDPRFQEDLRICTSYFANHDIKYDVDKMRAQSLASLTNTGITCCAAKDHPTLDALRDRPDLPTTKLEWLNRHDRESCDLYGVLPLMKGMPVAMTDYIDRSVDKRILKGRVGHIHSWV